MKTAMKLLALVMAMMMVLCLVACGNDTPTNTEPSTEPTGSTETTGNTEPDVTKPTDDGKKEYKVSVVDPEGNPVSGVMVQICKEGATCFTPSRTNEEGYSVWRLEEASDYYGTVSSLEEGMPKEYFEGNFEVTLVYDPPVAE